MNKEELLKELSIKLSTGELSRSELDERLGLQVSAQTGASTEENKTPAHFSPNKMLYILGASIVVIGIVIFINQIWSDMGSLGHIFVTLGFGLILTGIGSMLLKQKPEESIGLVFQCMGGLLIPGGAVVTLSEFKIDQVTYWPLAVTFFIIFIFYLLLDYIHKNAILTFFTIANATACIYLTVNSLLTGSFYTYGDLYAYLTMAVGVSYLLLAQSFRDGWNRGLVSVLCFFGSVFFFGAAFSRVFDSTIWQMAFFLLVMGGFALAVYMKNRSILVVSSIFLIAHVSYITGKYFADSLGWPISLVIMGFVFIALGYVSININNKYIKLSK